MKKFSLEQYQYRIICDSTVYDTKVSFETNGNTLAVYITAQNDRPQFVTLKWNFETEEDLYVLGDTWERSYGDLCFEKLSDNNRWMPWYFAATNKSETYCFGVKIQPNSFVNFTYNKSGITAKIDCRNGGAGVKLNGRTVKLCTFVFEHYSEPVFESLCEYCKVLRDNPLLPKEKIYGINNWYYAYGKSSYYEIIRDTKLLNVLTKDIPNKPFSVVDDGWEQNSLKGPYEPNEKYGDMKALADEIKSLGAHPGIWIRLLDNASEIHTPDMRILRDGKREYLDPTNEKVKEYIVHEIEKVKLWGYELLKHDFSTFDLFGDYGKNPASITDFENWHFEDETKTNAEIVLDFYRLIKDTCGDMLIIGCNTISHLCAGLVHINRTGDDTSGKEWERTRQMGVNTLAFRLAQNNAFYMVDADCVGIMNNNIPWEKNKQWLDLLSKSDTAFFVSCDSATDEQKADLKNAYLEIQNDHKIKPLDIYENLTPSEWEIDGCIVNYKW